MQLTLLPAYEYTRVRWRNALGWSREIDRQPGANGEDAWRLSIAEIDHDCAYSPYPGLRREQVLLEGNGFTLDFADGSTHTCSPPHGRCAFDGAQAPECRLHDGPVRVFNLFHDPQRVTATLHHRPLVGPLLIFAEPHSTWVIHLLAGRMSLPGNGPTLAFDQGDSLRLENAGEQRQRLLLEGGGELLLISFGPP
jgi:environmental stress-induced protein Ves